MTEWYDYKLSDGSSGTTNINKKEFKKMLKKGIKIRGWKKK